MAFFFLCPQQEDKTHALLHLRMHAPSPLRWVGGALEEEAPPSATSDEDFECLEVQRDVDMEVDAPASAGGAGAAMDVSTENIGNLLFESLSSRRELIRLLIDHGGSALDAQHGFGHASRQKSKGKGRSVYHGIALGALPVRPLEPCSFLEPGTSFRGTQDVTQAPYSQRESWNLAVTVEGCDWDRGYVCGTMEAEGLNCSIGTRPVVTFWEGELIDNKNYFFRTNKWGATNATDKCHWLRFPAFDHLNKAAAHAAARAGAERAERNGREGAEQGGSGGSPQNHAAEAAAASCALDAAALWQPAQSCVFLRLKEQYFIDEEPGANLTIAGFYYMCISRQTGEMCGYYYDPNSTPFQKVHLNVNFAGQAGHCSAACEMA